MWYGIFLSVCYVVSVGYGMFVVVLKLSVLGIVSSMLVVIGVYFVKFLCLLSV